MVYLIVFLRFLKFLENRKCPDSEFRCNSTGRCVPWAWVCDKEDDCKDGTDESVDQDCPHPTDRCGPEGFMCANKKCILAVSIRTKRLALMYFTMKIFAFN